MSMTGTIRIVEGPLPRSAVPLSTGWVRHTLDLVFKQATRSLINAQNKARKPGTRSLGAGAGMYGHDLGLRRRGRAIWAGHDRPGARAWRHVARHRRGVRALHQ